MRNRNYYKQLVHRICRAACTLLEIAVFAAIPLFAFWWSGRYTEKLHLMEAAVDSLTGLDSREPLDTTQQNEDTDYVTADGIQSKTLMTVDIRGLNNTGYASGFLTFVKNSFRNMPEEEKNAMYINDFAEGGYVSEEYTQTIIDMAQDNEKVMEILSQVEEYPKSLLETLAKYPQTVDYVYYYPDKKDIPVAETVGTVIDGEVPLLLQWDERWGYAPYGSGFIGNTGCGPTCLSMVIVALTGDTGITPKVLCDYAEDAGYYEPGAGTKWSFMTEGAAHFGVTAQNITLSEESVMASLDAGHPVICCVGPGDFTTVGHFIVLTKAVNGSIQVNDPNSTENSEKLWSYDEIKGQIRSLWSYQLSQN